MVINVHLLKIKIITELFESPIKLPPAKVQRPTRMKIYAPKGREGRRPMADNNQLRKLEPRIPENYLRAGEKNQQEPH